MWNTEKKFELVLSNNYSKNITSFDFSYYSTCQEETVGDSSEVLDRGFDVILQRKCWETLNHGEKHR